MEEGTKCGGTPGEGALQRGRGWGDTVADAEPEGGWRQERDLPEEGWAISGMEEQRLKHGGLREPGLAGVLAE